VVLGETGYLDTPSEDAVVPVIFGYGFFRNGHLFNRRLSKSSDESTASRCGVRPSNEEDSSRTSNLRWRRVFGSYRICGIASKQFAGNAFWLHLFQFTGAVVFIGIIYFVGRLFAAGLRSAGR